MARYKLLRSGVLHQELFLSIPNDITNRHWQKFQVWLAEGNIPDAADPVHISTDTEIAETRLAADPVFRALIKFLANRFGLTPLQLVEQLKALV